MPSKDSKPSPETRITEPGFAEQSDEELDLPPVPNPLLGKVFAERYTILSVLGEGGMSVVYLGRHEAMNKLVAIKTLHNYLASKNTNLLRFKQEAQSVSRLSHPGIVAVHDYGVTDDATPYLVMDYVEGETLSALLARNQFLPEAQAIELFLQTAAAIGHAHSKGIVHRDVKPSNIMLHDEGMNLAVPTVKIVDFGVAKLVETTDASRLTQTGEAIGSPFYMSPEQCLNQQMDTRSDIYSLGCVMYETLMGTPPLVAEGIFATMMKHMHDIPERFKTVRPGVQHSETLEKIVFKAMAKDPAKRYQTMQELQNELQSVQKERGFISSVMQKLELSSMRSSSKRVKQGLLVVGVIAALIGLGCWGSRTAVAISEVPSETTEPVIWQRYNDSIELKPQGEANTEKSQLQSLFLEKMAPKDASESDTMANSLRNKHQYDDAKPFYTKVIKSLRACIDAKDVSTCMQKDRMKFVQALLNRADCEYFAPMPQFSAAAQDYEDFGMGQRTLEHQNGSSLVGRKRQLEARLNGADCHYFLRNDGVAEQLMDKLLEDATKTLKKEDVRALFFSKLGELKYRLGNLKDAQTFYDEAHKRWTRLSTNDKLFEMLCIGRLAQIADKSDADPDASYAQFMKLLAGLEKSKRAEDPVIANIVQSYAHHMWTKGQLIDAMQLHQQADSIRFR